MGVQGLWELLAPVGRRVSVETLAGKRVAIDASIWMVQFMKAMRDEKGEMIRNAHLIGFFRRICKLLFLRTKPVFVFDGGTPALKRRTVIARRRQRENAQAKIRKTAEKLLLNHLKAVRLKELAKELESQRQQQKKNGSKGKSKSFSSESTQAGIDSVDQITHQENTDEMLTAQVAAGKDARPDNEGNETEEMVVKNEAKGKKILSDDGSRAMKFNQEELDEMLAASIAAEEDGGSANNASTSHATIQLEDELDDEDEDEEMLLPVMHRDVDPNVLAALPPSMQLDLLVQMRERLMAENRQKYQKVKKAPEKFSELQIQAYLKTVAFRREIDGVQKAAGGRGVCGVQTSRIASEANREFIFSSSFTGDKQELASARGEGNEKKQQNTGTLHHNTDSINNAMSICKSNSMIGLGPEETKTDDDDVETYVDEMGRVRVSRHRAMGICMTRDLQRNLDLMKEIDQEKTVPIKVTNIESTTKRDLSVSPKIFSSENQSGEISQEGIVEPVNMNYKLEQSMFNSGASVEISFEDNDNNNTLDDSDDIFARLAAGVPVTISSSVNSPKKKPSCSPSDCEWEEEPVEGKCNSSLGDVKNDIQPSLHECNLSDESEVEWEETPPDSHVKGVPFPPKLGEVVSQGHLQEEADLQEAIKRSLLDLGCEESSQAFSEPEHSKRPSNFTDEEINLGGINFPEVSGIQQNKLLSETVDVINKFNTAGGVNISQAFDSPDSHLNFSTIHDSEDNVLLISKKLDNHACSYSEQSLNNTTEGDSVDRETPYVEAVFAPEAKKAPSLSEQCSDETNHDYGIPIIANNNFGDNSLHSNANSVEMPDVLLVENKKIDSEAEPFVLLSSKVKNMEDESSVLVDRHDIKPELLPQSDHPSNPLVESSKKELTCDLVMDPISTVESSHENQYQTMQHNMDNFAIKDTENVPVEYTEASLEDEMLILDQERIDLGDEQRRLERNAESVSSEMFAECQELLQIFGLPYIIAPMEAEAQCAYMELMNIVDGVITDDSDVFLFGARSVYKNIFDDRKYVETYLMKDIEKELGLSREKLIYIALLLGSDYTEGVSGIGIVNAIEVVNAFPEEDGLLKFREWIESPDPTILGKLSVQSKSSPRKRGSKVGNNDITGSVEGVPACNESILQANESKQTTDDIHEIKHIFMNKHRNVSKNWHIPSSFPSEAVISAYTCPQVDKSTDPFTWGKPDLMVLRKLCWEKFGWNIQKTDELLLPVLKEYEKRETQLRLEAFYTFNERFAKIRSKRIKKAVKGISGNQSSELMDDSLKVLSKSRKKGVFRSEGGDDKLEKPLLKDEDTVDMQNSEKESTSNRSSKRASRRKLVTSESVPKSPLIAGSKKDCNEGSCEIRKGRGRGRGRGQGLTKGRRKRSPDVELFEVPADGPSDEDEQDVNDENLERPQAARRSKRSRNPVNYNVDDLEVDEAEKSLTNKVCPSEETIVEDLETRAVSGDTASDFDAKKQPDSLDPLFKESVNGEYLHTGGGFCAEEDEVGQSVSEKIYHHLEDDDCSNDHLEKGGGFCITGSKADNDKDSENVIIGVSTVGSSQLISRPKRKIDTSDAEQTMNASKRPDDTCMPQNDGVNKNCIASAGSLSAMPFLKKKKRKC